MAIKTIAAAAKECGVTAVAVYLAIARKDIKGKMVTDAFGEKRLGVPDSQIEAYKILLASRPKRGPKPSGPKLNGKPKRKK